MKFSTTLIGSLIKSKIADNMFKASKKKLKYEFGTVSSTTTKGVSLIYWERSKHFLIADGIAVPKLAKE